MDLLLFYQALHYNQDNMIYLPSSISTRRYLPTHFSIAIATIAIKSKVAKRFILMEILTYF